MICVGKNRRASLNKVFIVDKGIKSRSILVVLLFNLDVVKKILLIMGELAA